MAYSIAFRRARKPDREYHDWGVTYEWSPWVITIDGKVAVIIGKNNEILYQFGSAVEKDWPDSEHSATEVIAHLMRAWMRVMDALNSMSYYEESALKRGAHPPKSIAEMMEEALRKAEAKLREREA